MKKVLILGVGSAQEDLIIKCKEKGFKIYACAYAKNKKLSKYIDYFFLVDIKDYKEVLKIAKVNNIDAVLSVGSDIAMPTVAYVSEKLNLPSFISYKTALILNNKLKMRKLLSNYEDIKFLGLKNKSEIKKWNLFPAVIKPVDSQGQRGVFKVNNQNELYSAFDKSIKYSRSKTVIIEEFINGNEISVNTYLVDGNFILFYITDRISFEEYPGGIIKEHHYPFSKPSVKGKIKEKVINLINKLKITNGPLYFQMKLFNDEPYIIEMTPRFDGCHLWNLIKHTHRLDLLDIYINHLVFNKIEAECFINKQPLNDAKYKLVFFTAPPNTKFQNPKITEKGEILYKKYYYNEGEIIRPINGFMEKIGYYIIRQPL